MAEQQLRELLGDDVPDQTIRRLLTESGGNVQAAVELHFSGRDLGEGEASNANPGQGVGRDQVPTLRSMGLQGTDEQLMSLMRRAGSVEAALELYFEEGLGGGGSRRAPGTLRQAGGPSNPSSQQQGARWREDDDVILLSSDDEAGPPAAASAPATARQPAAQPARSARTPPSAARTRRPARTSAAVGADEANAADAGPARVDPPQEAPPPAGAASPSGAAAGRAASNRSERSRRASRRPIPSNDYVAGTSSSSSSGSSSSSSSEAEDNQQPAWHPPAPVPNRRGRPSMVSNSAWSQPSAVRMIDDTVVGPLLDTATLCTARARQPDLPKPPQELPLPLKQHRDTQDPAMRLLCTQPDQVPKQPVPPPTPIDDFTNTRGLIKLGSIELPLLPAHTSNLGRGRAQHLLLDKQWWGAKEPSTAMQGLMAVQRLMAAKVLPPSSFRLVGVNDGPSYQAKAGGYGVGVMQGSTGWDQLLAEWTDLGLPTSKVQTEKLRQAAQAGLDAGFKTKRCIVFGYLPNEYMSLTSALSKLCYVPVEDHWAGLTTADNWTVLKVSFGEPKGPGGTLFTSSKLISGVKAKPPDEPEPAAAAGTSKQDKAAGKQAGGQAAAGNRSKADKDRSSSKAASGVGESSKSKGSTKRKEPDGKSEKPEKKKLKSDKSNKDDKGGEKSDRPSKKVKVESQEPAPKSAEKPKTKPEKPQTPGAVTIPMNISVVAALVDELCTSSSSVKESKRLKPYTEAMAEVLHALLSRGNGLWIGPDSDGLLNFCDTKPGGDVQSRHRPTTPAPDHTTTTTTPTTRAASAPPEAAGAAVVGGMTVSEHASMAHQELARLKKAHLTCVAQEKTCVSLLGKSKTALTRLQQQQEQQQEEGEGMQRIANRAERSWQLQSATKSVEANKLALSAAKAHKRALDIAVTLAQRSIQAFAHAELCDPLVETDATPSGAEAAAGDVNGAAPPSPDGAGPSTSRPAAGPSTPSSAAKAAVKKPAQPPVLPQELPWVPDICLALVLAAEQVSGKRLLKRDLRSWVVTAGIEEVKGVIAQRETISAQPFGVHALLDSVATHSEYPVATPPEHLRTKPKEFQLQGLKWMLSRERHSDALNRGVLHLEPQWLQLCTTSGWIFYVNRLPPYALSTYFVPAAVETTCGGFLCDEMGLGKSLESLMLILSNPPEPGWAVSGKRHPLIGKDHVAVPIRATLLVMPSNLMQQWQDEVETHVEPGALRCGVYQGSEVLADTVEEPKPEKKSSKASAAQSDGQGNRRKRGAGKETQDKDGKPPPKTEPFVCCLDTTTKSMASISEFDLLFISYEQLRKEINNRKCALLKYGFYRIMLDEAQLVANTNSVAAEMASSMWRRFAWVVTGTPISSRLSEVAGLCEFLDASPFYKPVFWRPQLQVPFEGQTRGGLLSMRSLLSGVMLRRTKAQVEAQLSLPPCIHEDWQITLSGVERAVYDQQLTDFRHAMKILKSAQRAAANDVMPGDRKKRLTGATARVMSSLTALRQCCCHPHIVKRQAGSQQGTERASMRQIMGKLVMQAYANLDSAAASYFTARMLLSAVQFVMMEVPSPGKAAGGVGTGSFNPGSSGAAGAGSSGGAGGGDAALSEVELAALLVELQGNGLLAGEPDIRLSLDMRLPDGTAALDMDMVSALVRSNQDKLKTAQVTLQTSSGSIHQMTLLEGPPATLLAVQPPPDEQEQGPGGVQVAGAGTLHAPAATAAGEQQDASGDVVMTVAGDGQEEGQEQEAPPVQVHVSAVRDSRPFGLFPRGAYTARNVLAVMKQAGGDAAPGRQAAGSADVSQDTQLLQLAAQQELEQELKVVLEAQRERRRRWARLECDLLSLQAYTLRKRFANVAHLAQEAEAVTWSEEGGSQAWGETASEEEREAAVQLVAARQRLNVLRLELGLEPVVDVDNAELRRSRRQPGKGDGPTAVQLVLAAADWDSQDDLEEEDDDEEAAPSRKSAKKGKSSGRKKSKQAPSQGAAPLTALEMFLRSEHIVRRMAQLLELRDPVKSAMTEYQTTKKAVEKALHDVQHMMHKEQESLRHIAAGQDMTAAQDAAEADLQAGAGAAGAGEAGVSRPDEEGAAAEGTAIVAGSGLGRGGGGGAGPSKVVLPPQPGGLDGDHALCPICFDIPERTCVTTCGHRFCADCMNSLLAPDTKEAPCPMCRKPLTRNDLIEALSAVEEAALQAERARNISSTQGTNYEYGAKVAALLEELGNMQQQDPDAKALVLSSWGKLLRLVMEALTANGVPFASYLAINQQARLQALNTFHHDPDCRVLLLMMSTSGGAAGLTLTRASTAFLMEPSVNPGLESQAAARIHRLGQQRPTRIIRFITTDTVEQRVLSFQKQKLLASGKAKQSTGAGRSSGASTSAGAGAQQETTADGEMPSLTVQDLDQTSLVKFFGDL